tara:strand:- start:261 stop:491 length:231 start_codon:yes stop_codon:yes gene_type:complete
MQFETNVPIPAPMHGGAQKTHYPFNQLEVGESVLFPCIETTARHKARKAAYQRATYLNWEITVRSMPEGVRVWRHK